METSCLSTQDIAEVDSDVYIEKATSGITSNKQKAQSGSLRKIIQRLLNLVVL